MSRYQHGYHWASLATPFYRPSPPADPQGYIPYRHRAAGRPVFAHLCEGFHWSTFLMSSSLLLQQCPACLVRLILIFFVMGGRWPHSCYFVACGPQDSLKLVDKFTYLGSSVTSTEKVIDTLLAKHGQLSIAYRSYGIQTWPIKGNPVSSEQRSCRYCYMDALHRR